MPKLVNREIRLRSRPDGMPSADNFELVEGSVPEAKPGEILVRNLWMSVDPYMRGRMIQRRSYVQAFEVGKVLEGGSIGVVVDSKNERFAVGDHVLGMQGWRDYWTSDGRGVGKVNPQLAPVQAYLGVLGMPGLTAYAGLLKVGELKDGENVFVSGAAGAVGSLVCQIAKIKGCRVMGSAGSDDKLAWLREEAGVDYAFNYKNTKALGAEMSKGLPEGIDVYFENVGGPQLEAALLHMRDFGRVVVCGLISQYNDARPEPGPSTLGMVILRRLRIQGFIVTDHADLRERFLSDMAGWIAAGKIRWKETVYEGLERAPDAFLGLFRGENLGKMLVRIAEK
ncbi:MAG: NADP-dependent oxidoreductase [Pirellulales bacterium]|nr:NADP-dependent oxidoreductase [Pirellulales bacterium]